MSAALEKPDTVTDERLELVTALQNAERAILKLRCIGDTVRLACRHGEGDQLDADTLLTGIVLPELEVIDVLFDRWMSWPEKVADALLAALRRLPDGEQAALDEKARPYIDAYAVKAGKPAPKLVKAKAGDRTARATAKKPAVTK